MASTEPFYHTFQWLVNRGSMINIDYTSQFSAIVGQNQLESLPTKVCINNTAISEVSTIGTKRRYQSLPSSRNVNDSLNEDIQNYINLSLASTTHKTYTSGENRFISFIHLHKRKQVEQCLPADELLLAEFVPTTACNFQYQQF